jgi:sulfite reductase (ferredoxin)
VPEVVEVLSKSYVAERQDGENFRGWVERVGKKRIRALIEALIPVPAYEADPSFYSDWGDPREYTIGDIGVGECAGEVVSFVEMGLAASEREVFEAQLLLDQGDADGASARALSAMLQAARALTREKNANLGEDPDEIVREFRDRLVDTKLFHDPFAGPKFAHYLFKAHADGADGSSAEKAHQRIEEAQLFVDAAHQCHARLGSVP